MNHLNTARKSHAGDSQRESQVPVVPWGKGVLSRQGQQRPRVKEAGRRQAARPRAERRPARRGPPHPRRRHGVVARRVRPRLPDGRPRQGEGQAGLLSVLLREEEAREADKARLALGPSARKECGEASVPPTCRRDFANIGLGGYAWQLWGCIVFDGLRAG